MNLGYHPVLAIQNQACCADRDVEGQCCPSSADVVPIRRFAKYNGAAAHRAMTKVEVVRTVGGCALVDIDAYSRAERMLGDSRWRGMTGIAEP